MVYDEESDYLDIEKFKNVLRQVDKPWIEGVMESSINQYNKLYGGTRVDEGKRKAIVGFYFKNLNSLKQWKAATWQDSIEYEAANAKKPTRTIEQGYESAISRSRTSPTQEVESEKVYLDKDDDEFELTDDIVRLFGEGYDLDAYRRMWKKYNWLKESYVEFTNFHTEALVTYVRYKVSEEIAIAKGDADAAVKWSEQAAKAADRAKINPKQMSKADLEGGINSFSELAQSIEQAVDVIPILPKFKYRPNDSADFIIWCYVNYMRRLEDKPDCSYEDIYRFYDERKKSYIDQYGDPTGIFSDDPTEGNRGLVKQFSTLPADLEQTDEPFTGAEEVVIGGD